MLQPADVLVNLVNDRPRYIILISYPAACGRSVLCQGLDSAALYRSLSTVLEILAWLGPGHYSLSYAFMGIERLN